MPILNKAKTTFSYQLPDLTIQTGSFDSNNITSSLVSDLFTAVKSSDKSFSMAGGTIIYTLTLTNLSTFSAKNITIKDLLSAGSTFVAGSVTINGISSPAVDIVTGFSVPDIIPTGITVVKYSVTVATVSVPNNLSSSATLSVTLNDLVTGDKVYSINSNSVLITIVKPTLSVVKAADKKVVQSSDQILYTIVITNTGTVKATNVKFIDNVPTGTSFNTGTFKINGSVVNVTFADLSTGVALPDMNVSDVVNVEFKVTVS